MLPCIILCQRWRLVCYVCFADVRMLLLHAAINTWLQNQL